MTADQIAILALLAGLLAAFASGRFRLEVVALSTCEEHLGSGDQWSLDPATHHSTPGQVGTRGHQ